MNKEPIIKKKKINFKAQYVYNGILLLVLTLGIAYAFVFFLHNEAWTNASLTSSLVTVDVSEEGTISLSNATPSTDEEGLNGISKVITVKNNSNIDTLLRITLNPDNSNTISTESIRYGLFINGSQEKIDYVGPSNIIYDGLLLAGETIEYEIYLWIDSYYTEGGTSFSGVFEVEAYDTVLTISDYVSKLVGKDKGIYAINSSGSVSTDGSDVREYRYSGNDADNYVWFNCKDGYTSGSDNCELWRIVGIFDVKANQYANTYQRVKLVKEEALANRTFGSNNTYSGSTLDTYLNGDYYNSLTDSAKKMIISGEWNTGSSVLTNTPNASLTSEIKSKIYKKIGLLSASDLGYATNTDNYTKALNNTDLYTNSWLKGSSYYTLTPVTSSTANVIGDNATAVTSLAVGTATGIKPAVYLMPNVYAKGGNGTIEKPYELNYIDEVEHYSNVGVVGYITYNVNGASVDTPNKQAIYADGSTVIKVGFDDASFAGWATSANGEAVYQKGDTLTQTSDVTLYAVWKVSGTLATKLKVSLASNLTEADADCNQFVYGKVENNYVWYSGKLWRIVSINCDGSIKLVTQGNMTALTWSTSGIDTEYKKSLLHTWLNSEFLPTLYDAGNLLVNATWDYTTYEQFPTTKLATTTSSSVMAKVGLINIYEYMKTGGTNDSGTTNTFLNNGYDWWIISRVSNFAVWGVESDGVAGTASNYGRGVRPSVNLKSEISILYGTGEKGNPYIIDGDKVLGGTLELLSNRISGEYIKFNNTKYRIVGIEKINGEKLTKVTMADYSRNKNTLTTSLAFNFSDFSPIYSTSKGIGKYLLDWYNGTSIGTTYKNMIATEGIIWYTGSSTDSGSINYTLSKTGTAVEAPIGLPYYGEMFSSQFGDGEGFSTAFWLITRNGTQGVRYIDPDSTAYYQSPAGEQGVRPSFYLKTNVGIIGGTGQTGTPYEITMDSTAGNTTPDTAKPVCEFSGPDSNHIDIESSTTFSLECRDYSSFSDSIITASDITLSKSGVVSVGTPTKSTITNGYSYTITVTGVSGGSTTLTLKAGVVSDSAGNTNDAITSSSVFVLAPDSIKPVCTFFGPTVGTISTGTDANTSEFSIECGDNKGIFNDYEITASDFEFSSDGVVEISNISKSSITGGYKYTITVNALNDGTTTLTLKSGVVSDREGNTNDSVTSNSINVATVVADSTPPSCEFSGPADSRIYVMSSPQTTEFYLTCTDESEFGDSDITTTDFTVGNTSIVAPTAAPGGPGGPGGDIVSDSSITVTGVTKTAITGGYKYTITVSASLVGSSGLTLKTGVISDKYGNSNTEAVSDIVTVSFRNMG